MTQKRNPINKIVSIAFGFALAACSTSQPDNPTPSPGTDPSNPTVNLKDNVLTSTDRVEINVANGDTTLEFYNLGTANSYHIYTKWGKTKKNSNNATFEHKGTKSESTITKVVKNANGAHLLTLDDTASFMLSNKKGLLQPFDNSKDLYTGLAFEKISYQQAIVSGVSTPDEAKKVYLDVLKKSGSSLEITGATSGYAGDNAVRMGGQNYKLAIGN